MISYFFRSLAGRSAILKTLAGDLALADDLVSEAFVRVWTSRERVELTTVCGYLFAIVRNLFLQHLRHERLRALLDERIADDQAVLMRANGELPYEEIAGRCGLHRGRSEQRHARAG